MKKYSLFIGRFQPLHEGHIKLIRSVLDEGKNVCIALRGTPIDKDNPFSLLDRKAMFWGDFREELISDKMKLIEIPDIEEVCYGRKVGWGIREIRLDKDTEAISATKIREANNE